MMLLVEGATAANPFKDTATHNATQTAPNTATRTATHSS